MTGPQAEQEKLVQVEQALKEEIILPARPIASVRIVGIMADVHMLDKDGVILEARRVIRNDRKTGFKNVPAAVTDWVISESTKPKTV